MKLIKKLGRRSKKIREHKGISQAELAALIETKQAQVSNFEAGRSGRISLESFLKLIELYSKDNYNVFDIFKDKFEIKKNDQKI